jgi:hypothetical protein
MPALDFTMPGAVAAAFVAALSLPIFLLLAVRLPFLAGRNGLQFTASVAVTVGAWIVALLVVPGARPAGSAEIIVGIFLLATAVLVYLEIWSLMSRGYTLSLMLTIHHAGRPLPAAELARRYRGGEGLAWIMRHRLAGLEAAGLVRHQDDHLVLTPWLGRAVAWGYRLIIAVLGLKATG